MKIISIYTILCSLIVGLSTVTAVSNDYMGHNATLHDNDIALCARDLNGCITVDSNSSRCQKSPKLGSLEDLGTIRHMTWKYEDGMLKTREPYQSYWGVTYEQCLAPKLAPGTELEGGQEYTLELQQCEYSAHMKWLFVDQGKRIQSLAPVAGDIAVPYCLTVKGTEPSKATGSAVVLMPCDYSNDLQQVIQPVGGVLEPFLFPLQYVYGVEDVVELAYESNTDDPVVVTVFKEGTDDTLFSFPTFASSGVVSFAVSHIMDSDVLVATYYVAKLDEYEVMFVVEPEQRHVRHSKKSRFSSVFDTSGPKFGIALAIATAVISVAVLAYIVFRSKASNIVVFVDETCEIDDVEQAKFHDDDQTSNESSCFE